MGHKLDCDCIKKHNAYTRVALPHFKVSENFKLGLKLSKYGK